MAATRVVLNQRQLATLLSSPQGEVGQDMVRRAQRVLNAARVTCPVDTGNLRGSLAYEIATQASDITARVGTNVPYAPYVEAKVHFLAGALSAAAP